MTILMIKLDSYAWELGVVDEGQRKYAIQEAHKLIGKMQNNPSLWLADGMPSRFIVKSHLFIAVINASFMVFWMYYFSGKMVVG